ncbi:uncharacterized [Tachysurus ichikawai]
MPGSQLQHRWIHRPQPEQSAKALAVEEPSQLRLANKRDRNQAACVCVRGVVELNIWISAVLRRQRVSEVLEACQCPRARVQSKKSGPEAREERRGPEAEPPQL